jgi:hypothetical protein
LSSSTWSSRTQHYTHIEGRETLNNLARIKKGVAKN